MVLSGFPLFCLFFPGCELRRNSSAGSYADPAAGEGEDSSNEPILLFVIFIITLSARRAIRAKIQEG